MYLIIVAMSFMRRINEISSTINSRSSHYKFSSYWNVDFIGYSICLDNCLFNEGAQMNKIIAVYPKPDTDDIFLIFCDNGQIQEYNASTNIYRIINEGLL